MLDFIELSRNSFLAEIQPALPQTEIETDCRTPSVPGRCVLIQTLTPQLFTIPILLCISNARCAPDEFV
jgi:hypothetical protein